jgi:hypothetical protein
MRPAAAFLVFWMLATMPNQAAAWGDEGHEVVALIAQAFLDPGVRNRVDALLAADTDNLTAHDIASEATWADRYREANIDGSRARTRQWHFTDIEITAPDLDKACFNHPALPAGTVASNGPAADCVVDKTNQFAAELADPKTGRRSRDSAAVKCSCRSNCRRPARRAFRRGPGRWR